MLSKRKTIILLMLFAASASASPLVYVVTYGGQFGALDSTTGAFTQIGPTTLDPLGGLAPGPNGSLLGVSFGGNLDSINPATGAFTEIGSTGLGPAPATAPFANGELNGTMYETDGSNNLYTVNTTTGAASLIGATGLLPCPSVTNPDAIGDEAFFSAGGQLYLTFDAFNAITNAVLITPGLYRIDPVTAAATLIGPTAFGIDAALQLNGAVDGFTSGNTELSLNLTNGSTTFVTNYDQNALDITGVTSAPEPASFGLIGAGIASILIFRRKSRHSEAVTLNPAFPYSWRAGFHRPANQPERKFLMKRVLFGYQFAGVLTACAFLAQSMAAQGQKAPPIHYTVTDLGLANGSTPGQPFVIKNDGLIAGSADVSGTWHAALPFQGAQIDLAKAGGLGGPNSSAFGVNERAQAAGEAETKVPDPKREDFCGFGSQLSCQAFIWQNGAMSALPMLKDATGAAGHNAAAKEINLVGQVGGVAESTAVDSTCPAYDPSPDSLQFQTYQFKPVVWANGEIQQLPTAGNDSNGKAFNDPDGAVFRINNSGQAVGATGTCTGYTAFLTYLNAVHATLWQNGSVIDLGNLGGIGPAGFGNLAYDVNKPGHVAGLSGTKDGSVHAFFWSPETLIQDLGTVPGDTGSGALAINDIGDIAGISFPDDPTASPRAFIRPDGGTMVDLNSLIPVDSELYLFSACSINSRGEIIGLALDSQGNFHGYLATPGIGPEAPSVEVSGAMRRARFGYAWKVLHERKSPFGGASRR